MDIARDISAFFLEKEHFSKSWKKSLNLNVSSLCMGPRRLNVSSVLAAFWVSLSIYR